MKITKNLSVTTYTLEIDAKEARFLRDVTGQIGGCPCGSRRRIADDLSGALDNVGVRHEYVGDIDDSRGNGRGLYFRSV